NDAHTQPSGAYHYHGTPLALIAQLNPNSATSMTLVGWAADGFPMYSVEGYADTSDASSAIVDIESSYQTVSTAGSGRPSIDDFPLGHFIQDWEYVEGSGDLDECNGRFGVTPEFPEGIYHYYLTKTYPFIQRCVKGTSTSTSTGGPPPR
ncbi:MAG: YHYH protein, partial [Kofleriaceae bacterium]|nr:YHYH protein [Kofleriaceae bacterium]